MREIVETIGIAHVSVVSALDDHLYIRKPPARWVPRLLTVEYKCNRVITSKVFWRCSLATWTSFRRVSSSKKKHAFTIAHWRPGGFQNS